MWRLSPRTPGHVGAQSRAQAQGSGPIGIAESRHDSRHQPRCEGIAGAHGVDHLRGRRRATKDRVFHQQERSFPAKRDANRFRAPALTHPPRLFLRLAGSGEEGGFVIIHLDHLGSLQQRLKGVQLIKRGPKIEIADDARSGCTVEEFLQNAAIVRPSEGQSAKDHRISGGDFSRVRNSVPSDVLHDLEARVPSGVQLNPRFPRGAIGQRRK